MSDLMARPLLYTDTVDGEQVCQDDLWVVTTGTIEQLTKERDALREALEGCLWELKTRVSGTSMIRAVCKAEKVLSSNQG